MKTNKDKHEERFHRCPGAWIGNLPGVKTYGTFNDGHIVVDAKKAWMALPFLSRYYRVIGSEAYDAGCGGPLGLLIRIETKGKERIETLQPVSQAA